MAVRFIYDDMSALSQYHEAASKVVTDANLRLVNLKIEISALWAVAQSVDPKLPAEIVELKQAIEDLVDTAKKIEPTQLPALPQET